VSKLSEHCSAGCTPNCFSKEGCHVLCFSLQKSLFISWEEWPQRSTQYLTIAPSVKGVTARTIRRSSRADCPRGFTACSSVLLREDMRMVMAGTLMPDSITRVMKVDAVRRRQRPLLRHDATCCRLGSLPLRHPGYVSRQAT